MDDVKLLAKRIVADSIADPPKIEQPGQKLNSFTIENSKDTERYLNSKEQALKRERVYLRGERAVGTWLPDQNLVKVTKIQGHIMAHMGYQNKDGKFLYPEEALFLMESNKLEVMHNDVSLSILQAYNLFLNETDCTQIRYRVYHHLTSQGYHLLRKLKTQHSSQNEEDSEPPKKALDEEMEPPEKIRKIDEPDSSDNKSSMQKIFDRLRQNGPQEYKSSASGCTEPDYYVFLPLKWDEPQPDHFLYIHKSNTLDCIDRTGNSDIPSITAVCSDGCDDFSFYKFTEGHITDIGRSKLCENSYLRS